jgi:hypothetical protein
MNEMIASKNSFLSPVSPACYQMTIAKEPFWMNHMFSSVDFIPPCFSMLVCHLGKKQ